MTIMNKLKLIILSTILLFGKTPYDEISNIRDIEIKKLWTISKDSFDYSLSTLKDSPIELYFISSDSYNILKYAFFKKNYILVDELLEIYLQTIRNIKIQKNYNIYELEEGKEKTTINLSSPISIWTNQEGDEELISSAQFLFVVSFAFNQISSLTKKEQTLTMKKFIKLFNPILSSHYERWILGIKNDKNQIFGSFSRRGWGCKDKNENYIYARTLPLLISEITQHKYYNTSYCNVIDDPILLIISGLGYYLHGNLIDENLYNIPKKKILAKKYLINISNITKAFKHKTIKINQKSINILTFQEGAWAKHPDFQYSEYLGATFPTEKDIKGDKNIGIDIPHSSRVIYLLEMLYNTKKSLNSFPTKQDMIEYSDNFYYRVFNQDFNKPRFKNYLNGSNGWFRVNYDKREGYGYSPFMAGTVGALLGGYPRLSVYNSNISKIFIALFQKFRDKKYQKFIHENYGKAIWVNREKKAIYNFYQLPLDKRSALFLINFYSSLI